MDVRGNQGFTIIELVLVVAILGALAVFALPKFFSMTSEAEASSRDGVIGAVQSGVMLYRANDMVQNGGDGNYPGALDSLADGDSCSNGCFVNVLNTAMTDTSWVKVDSDTYRFNDGSNTYDYDYDSSEGTFD